MGGSATVRGALDTDDSTGGTGSATLRGALDTDDSTGGTGSATLRGALDTDDSTGGSGALMTALSFKWSVNSSIYRPKYGKLNHSLTVNYQWQ